MLWWTLCFHSLRIEATTKHEVISCINSINFYTHVGSSSLSRKCWLTQGILSPMMKELLPNWFCYARNKENKGLKLKIIDFCSNPNKDWSQSMSLISYLIEKWRALQARKVCQTFCIVVALDSIGWSTMASQQVKSPPDHGGTKGQLLSSRHAIGTLWWRHCRTHFYLSPDAQHKDFCSWFDCF